MKNSFLICLSILIICTGKLFGSLYQGIPLCSQDSPSYPQNTLLYSPENSSYHPNIPSYYNANYGNSAFNCEELDYKCYIQANYVYQQVPHNIHSPEGNNKVVWCDVCKKYNRIYELENPSRTSRLLPIIIKNREIAAESSSKETNPNVLPSYPSNQNERNYLEDQNNSHP